MTEEKIQEFGLFTLMMNQDYELTHESYQVYTFDAALGNLGGYQALLFSISAFLLASWQDFAYVNGLAN